MVRGIANAPIPAVEYSMVHGSKTSLPVEPSSLVYSHFEHVSGIPAPQGSQGVSISKLHLLNVLIEHTNKLSNGRAIPMALVGNSDNIISALAEGNRNLALQAKEASVTMPYIQSPSSSSGVLFSIIS